MPDERVCLYQRGNYQLKTPIITFGMGDAHAPARALTLAQAVVVVLPFLWCGIVLVNGSRSWVLERAIGLA